MLSVDDEETQIQSRNSNDKRVAFLGLWLFGLGLCWRNGRTILLWVLAPNLGPAQHVTHQSQYQDEQYQGQWYHHHESHSEVSTLLFFFVFIYKLYLLVKEAASETEKVFNGRLKGRIDAIWGLREWRWWSSNKLEASHTVCMRNVTHVSQHGWTAWNV